MKKDKILYLLILLVLFVLAGCRSTKQTSKKEVSNEVAVQKVLDMPALNPVAAALTAKMRISAVIGNNSFNAGGTIKMEQGAGIQMGITALGLFELARLEISPFDVQFVNKVNKEYAALSYTDVGFLQQTGLSYKILEAVFMNELFSYNDMPLAKALYDMTITRSADDVVLTTPMERGMQYRFFLNSTTGELVRTEGSYNNDVSVVCNYSKFEAVGARSFPRIISLVITGAEKNITLDLELSNIKTDTYRFKKSNISSYRKMNLLNLLKSIVK